MIFWQKNLFNSQRPSATVQMRKAKRGVDKNVDISIWVTFSCALRAISLRICGVFRRLFFSFILLAPHRLFLGGTCSLKNKNTCRHHYEKSTPTFSTCSLERKNIMISMLLFAVCIFFKKHFNETSSGKGGEAQRSL